MDAEKPETAIQRENSRRKLLRKALSIARSIITYEVGLSVGVWDLARHMFWLKDKYDVSINVPALETYLNEIRPIPFGPERLNCSREALRRYDEALLRINERFHDRIIDACFAVMNEFGDEETSRIRK